MVKDRVSYRSEKENFTNSRLPEFTEDEIKNIKGTFDYLGFNHYYTRLASDVEEEDFDDYGYDRDVRVLSTEDPSWEKSPNGNPVSSLTQYLFYRFFYRNCNLIVICPLVIADSPVGNQENFEMDKGDIW